MLVFIYLLGGIMHKNTRNLTTEIEKKKKDRSKYNGFISMYWQLTKRNLGVNEYINIVTMRRYFKCEFEKTFEPILQKSFDFFCAVSVLVSMLVSGIWNRLVLKGMTNRVCFGILSFIRNYHHVKIHFYTGFLLQSVILSYFRQFMEDCICEVHKRFTPHVASRKRTRLPRNGTYCRKPRQICTILFHLARAPEKAVRTPDCGLKQLRGSTLCKKK